MGFGIRDGARSGPTMAHPPGCQPWSLPADALDAPSSAHHASQSHIHNERLMMDRTRGYGNFERLVIPHTAPHRLLPQTGCCTVPSEDSTQQRQWAQWLGVLPADHCCVTLGKVLCDHRQNGTFNLSPQAPFSPQVPSFWEKRGKRKE